MTRTANEVLLDAAISHQIGLTRRAGGLVARLLRLVDACESEVVALLASVEAEGPALDRALSVARNVYADRYDAVGAELLSYASELVEYEASFARDGLRRVLPRAAAVRLPAPAALRASAYDRPMMGRPLESWAASLPDRAYQRFADAVRQSYAEGGGASQAIRRVRGTRVARWRDGATQSTRRAVETLVRTATNSLANAAREATYAANPELVREVLWVSSLDSGTSTGCAGRDGRTFAVGDGPRPASHWNCRSFVVAILLSWRQAGLPVDDLTPEERKAMSGLPPRRLTFARWLAGRTAAEQDEVLGPRRARLYRAGLVSVDRFSDDAGRAYTLDELRARDRAAFDAVA